MTEEQKSNTFEQMEKQYDGVKIEKTEKPVLQEKEVEVGMEIFNNGGYLNTPEVGESITFIIDKIVNNPNTAGKNKTTGEDFFIGVTKKNGTVIRNDIITPDGDRFTLNSWALVYLFLGKDSLVAAKSKELGSYKGIEVKLTRNYDGSVPNKKTKDVMKLYDLESEEAAKKYQEEVADAMKQGKLFTLEIIE